MSETAIKISVIIPAYNGEGYICRAVDSVLGQTYPAYEIIVVDDGSTDGTSDKVAGYGDQVRYLRQSNAGPGAARNRGIEAATGNWIAFLDADDMYLPDRLKQAVEMLNNNPQLCWCAGSFIKCLEAKYSSVHGQVIGQPRVYADYFSALQTGDLAWTGMVLVKRSVFLDCGMFRTDINFGEDVDLWWRIGYRYPAYGYSAQPGAVYFMDISGSLARKRNTCREECDLLTRHIALAKEQGAYERFRPVARKRVKDWIRGAKFDERVYEIRTMLDEFGFLTGAGYKLRARLLTFAPTLTMRFFQMLSKINQKYKIREKAVHPRD